MKYTSKKTLSNMQRMKHLKKSMNKMKEMADRNSKDPDSGSNTRLQKSGMGERANSHAKKVGSILHHNAAEKAAETIDKMYDPDKNRELVKKKLKKIKKDQEVVVEDNAEFIGKGNSIKVIYNNREMSLAEFIKDSKVDTGMSKLIRALMAKRKQENFEGSLQDFIKKNFKGNDRTLDIVYRGNRVVFNKD